MTTPSIHRFLSAQNFTAYPIEMHFRHRHHSLDALHCEMISAHETRIKWNLTHQLPLREVNLSVMVLVCFID